MTSDADFKYDVFLSHSVKDKNVVRKLAERLTSDGVRVWFAEWMFGFEAPIAPIGSGVEAEKIEEGLENSRTLVLCMSANAFNSDWPQLESHAFRFKDPLNSNRRFIALRLDDAPTKGTFAQLTYINWGPNERGKEYPKLLQACLPKPFRSAKAHIATQGVHLDCNADTVDFAFCEDGHRVIAGGNGYEFRLWEVPSGRSIRVFEGHNDTVECLAWNTSLNQVLSGSYDNTIRLWDVATGECIRVFEGHTDCPRSVVWTADVRYAISGAFDRTIRIWDVASGECVLVLEGHTGDVNCVSYTGVGNLVASASSDGTVRLWDLTRPKQVRVLRGHTAAVGGVAWNSDASLVASGASDATVRFWDVPSGECSRVLEGHAGSVGPLAWSRDSRYILSGGGHGDGSGRVWDTRTGRCVRVLSGEDRQVVTVAWSGDGCKAIVANIDQYIAIFDLSDLRHLGGPAPAEAIELPQEQVEYTNAKVLLVGNSASGKTGLSNRLTHHTYKVSDSTVGAWATQWKLPLLGLGVEREVWLWDFGGQADQRLIHQLYMDETQVAVLVFDPQKQDLLQGLLTWDHDLTQAATGDFHKLLVAGRIDVGGLRSVNRQQVEDFAKEHGFARYIETSAKENIGCEQLKEAICELIDWENIAARTTPTLFRRIKEEIVALKHEGRVLMRFNDLREVLMLRINEDRFGNEELKAVILLLRGPGVVWELGFGSWLLLAPELVNAYAQAVIRTIQEDDHELGSITEECVLSGRLAYPKELERLSDEEERILLLAMHRILVQKCFCLSEPTNSGTLLVFPAYAHRDRPDLIEHPSVLVSYQFEGFLDDIYATLVVRLHRISPFTTRNLWNGAADFETMTGQRLGIKLSRKDGGIAELLVYFDPDIPVGERMIFSRYVQEHIQRKVKYPDQVKRLRHWICEKCGEPVANRERAMQRLSDDGAKAKIICVNCEQYIQLWDEMEAAFADPEIMRRVRELEAEADRELDNESKERALVGDVISTVSLAGQISREFAVSDHGIDMEIEFKTDAGEATGQRLYLQLKSGDSNLSKRKRDGAEIFKIPKTRHVEYWMNQAYPVMLIIRNSAGEIRWMEIRDHLKDISNNGGKPVRQIVFAGERFDVMSVRRWREKVLSIKRG